MAMGLKKLTFYKVRCINRWWNYIIFFLVAITVIFLYLVSYWRIWQGKEEKKTLKYGDVEDIIMNKGK